VSSEVWLVLGTYYYFFNLEGLPRPYGGWLKLGMIPNSIFKPPLGAISPFVSWKVMVSMQSSQDIPELSAIDPFKCWEVTITMKTCVKIVVNGFVVTFNCMDKRLLYKSLGAWTWSLFPNKWGHFADSEPCKR
jgi:hypothetical protein